MSALVGTSVRKATRYAGALDFMDEGAGLRGWALDVNAPGAVVVLEARGGDALLARSHCMLDRPDIDEPAGRPTHCGFLLGWSRFDRAALASAAAAAPEAEVELHIVGSQERLPNVRGPVTLAELDALVRAAPAGDQRPAFAELNAYHDIAAAGLFDAGWYLDRHGAEFAATTPPLLDYLRRGESAGARPNLLFDPVAYAAAAELGAPGGALLHFLRYGDTGGAAPSPHFDGDWYWRQTGRRGAAALAHCLAERAAPNSWFDPTHYAEASGERLDSNLYVHYVLHGYLAGQMPSAETPTPPEPVARDIQALLGHARSVPDARVAPPSPPSLAAPPPLPVATAPPPAEPLADPSGGPSYAAEFARLKGLSPKARAAEAARAGAAAGLVGPEGASARLTVYMLARLAGDAPATGRAAEALLAVLATLPSALAAETIAEISLANHAMHEAGGQAEALPVYRLLRAAGSRDHVTTLRLLEAALAVADRAEAAALAPEVETSPQLNVWGRIALSRHHAAAGAPARAVAALAGVPSYPEAGDVAEAAVLHRLIDLDALDAAAERLAHAVEAPAELLAGPRFRLAVRQGDVALLLQAITGPRADAIPNWQLADALFRLTTDGRTAGRETQRLLRQLYRVMEERGLSDNSLVQARIHFLLQHRRWDQLGALFDEVELTPFATLRETLLRKLEFHCYADNIDEAERIYRAHFQDTPLGKWEGLAILRMFGDLKRWDEAGRVLLAHLRKGHGLGSAQHTAMRVVRRAALHEEVLAVSLEAAEEDRAEIDAFLALVQEDLAIVERARALTANLRGGQRHRRYRSDWLLQPGQGDAGSGEADCVFLCANQRYFLSLLTFLCSFLGQTPQTQARIFVFLDDDVPKHWYGTIAMVAARFNRSIEIVPEGEFVPREVEHRAEYGFFAGGSGLSRAAYFRLYAARYLLDRFALSRAAYLDTDTICRGDLTGLFEVDLGDALISAATEDISPEVIHAATRNRLDPWQYFNSGVLLLRMDSPLLREHIEEAIRVSEGEPERLFFHDQCALNIAFQGQVTPLPPRYNFFLRPSRERNGYIEDGVLLHFLDKPKPWDIVFDRSYREEWRVWALFLGALVPQSLYVDIFAAANRD